MAKEFIKAERILAFNNPLMNFSIHLSNILVCTFGAALIFKTANPIPDPENPGKTIIQWGELSVGQLSSLIINLWCTNFNGFNDGFYDYCHAFLIIRSY